ncbi:MULTISPECIES: hypothetical protein [unclassified Curtobacterium]|uniref:hypothetical protein n=1 Tax=unclassified Curtobacterium TaxID=257496 RepID=UPI0008DE5D5B|nr:MULTISPECIES: hypothetical protein [unclassified Curtobacterium]OIH98072.1 hypothetical protein BIU92_14890 [Curtobacterium sp. MCBA15_003]OII11211.1 hypothetical protein BIU97_04675 [Curtobacterium sp. MCBA15_009]OII32807.1 hypothetical protein BIU94_15985 [Curtobacterium sp. MMLR14_006]
MTDTLDDGTIDPRWARVRPLVFRTIIGAVVAAGLVGIVAVLLGDFGRVAVQLLLTIVVVVVFALLSWYDADVSSQRSGTFAFASVLTSLYLLVAGLVKVWIVPTDPYGGDGIWLVGERFWQWIGLVAVARVALLHVHLLLVIHRRFPTPVLQVVAKSTVGVIALLALLVSIPLLAPGLDLRPGYWRLVWVVVILDLLGTVVVPLSNALFRPRDHHDASVGSWGPLPFADPSPGPGPAASAWGATPGSGAVSASAPPTAWEPSAPPAPMSTPAASAPAAPTPAAAVPVASPDTDTVTGPDGFRYATRPTASRALAWPRYVDGSPLPALADGTPDFSGVARG